MINYSIIVPHYESLDVLRRAVDSVPEREDIELIIVDNSHNKIDSNIFQTRSNVHVYYSPCGTGAGAARNIGLSKAHGQWLLLLDADDFFTKDAFISMDKHVNSEADIIFFKVTSCISDTYEPSDRHIPFNALIDAYHGLNEEENDLRYLWASPWGKMIHTSMVKNNDIFFDEVKAANDVTFSLLTGFQAGSIAVSQDTIYCVTTHAGSLTLTPSIENLTDRVGVFIRYNKFVRAHHLASKYKKSIMIFVYQAYKSAGIKAAMKLVRLSIREGNNPLIGIGRWGKTVLNMSNRIHETH